ncbi:MAG: tRNA lysidine(34) synthetase TilS [Thermoguttaceae bacterium]
MRLNSAMLPKSFLEDIVRHGVVLAVSGGADSTALAHLVCDNVVAGERANCVAIAHFNHALRGSESDGDAEFVQNLAASLGVRCVIERFAGNTTHRDDSGSIESTLRTTRYTFLKNTAETFGFRYVATAHTRDDQVETILHRIVRGTGIAGLSAMGRTRQLSDAVTLVRPLLGVARKTLRDYIAQIGLPFREDSSNADEQFTRNRLRNIVLPILRRENPAVDTALVRLAEHAAAQQKLIDDLVCNLVDRATITTSPSEIVLKTELLRATSPFLVGEMFRQLWNQQSWRLRAMGASQWQRLVTLVATGGTLTLPDGVCACVNDETTTLHQHGQTRTDTDDHGQYQCRPCSSVFVRVSP